MSGYCWAKSFFFLEWFTMQCQVIAWKLKGGEGVHAPSKSKASKNSESETSRPGNNMGRLIGLILDSQAFKRTYVGDNHTAIC